jgi:hypothetical protein
MLAGEARDIASVRAGFFWEATPLGKPLIFVR